jgi:predicted patatin/cPLA2 family phospholipase
MKYSIHISGAQDSGPWLRHTCMALACEGGGQRGIFTAGVLDTFLDHEFFPFRVMVGTSAGAQNLSAYACGQRNYARRIIMRYSTRRAFFDPMRFARGGHLIDLDWLFDTSAQEMPLDLQRGERRLDGRKLLFCASRSDTLRAEYFPFRPDDWGTTVKASSAIPLFYRGGVTIDGRQYWDGGVADALPVAAAHEHGGDCVLLIRTLPASHAVKPLKLPARLTGGKLSNMAAILQTHLDSYLVAHRFIAEPPPGVTVIELAPSVPLKSQLVGSRPEALRHDYRLGQACARQFLERHAWRLRRHIPGN